MYGGFSIILSRMTKEVERHIHEYDWDKFNWNQTSYDGVHIATMSIVPNPNDPGVPLSSFMAVRIDGGKELPPHWHKRSKEWLETIYITDGNYTVLGFAEDTPQSGELTIRNDHMEVFGIRNDSNKPLFLTSFMVPGYTGPEENKGIEETWQPGNF